MAEKKPKRSTSSRSAGRKKLPPKSSGRRPQVITSNPRQATNIDVSTNQASNIQTSTSEASTSQTLINQNSKSDVSKIFPVKSAAGISVSAHKSARSINQFPVFKQIINQNFFNKFLALIIVASLVFAIGVQVGQKRQSSVVDNAIDTLISNRPDKVNRGILERAAIEAALKASGDAWANYFPKNALDVLDEANTNSYSGVGATLRKSRGGVIEVSGVTPKSPAAESGVLVGDEVLEINGTDIQGASLTSAVALIRGSMGSKIDLLVQRAEKKVLISLTPRKVSGSNIEATQVGNAVGLVAISSFTAGTASELRRTLERLKIRDGLIIDLRNNPGGLIDEAVKVAELFIGNGTIVSYRVSGNEKIYAANNPIPITVPIVIMINRSTASAAEILASAMQDRNRGVVIGEKSYGKGSVQEFKTLADGSKLELTVALYLTPSGRTIEGVGVTPDLQVLPGELGTKALQILGGLASLTSPKAGTSK